MQRYLILALGLSLFGCAADAASPAHTRTDTSRSDESSPVEGDLSEAHTEPNKSAASTPSELPIAIQCYRDNTNANDIDGYMSCFADDAVMIDVTRTFTGKDDIRAWAIREVMGNGETFAHRKILEASDGYAKTEVNWLSWVVHYSYWWSSDGKITKMSLQYAN